MKACGAYFRDGEIFIHASAKNTFGIHRTSEPFFKLSQRIPPQELGEKILLALNSYREGVPGELYVRGVKRPLDPFLVFTKLRSWKKLEQGANYFSIMLTDSEIEIIPSTPAAKGGFLHRPKDSVRCAATAEQVARALLELALRTQ
jgi:hypothetical protein